MAPSFAGFCLDCFGSPGSITLEPEAKVEKAKLQYGIVVDTQPQTFGFSAKPAVPAAAPYSDDEDMAQLAEELVALLCTSEQSASELDHVVQACIHDEAPSYQASGSNWWRARLAARVLAGLERMVALKHPQAGSLGPTFRDALDRALHEAYGFAKTHPAYCALLALGVLAVLAPWALEALGFGAEGPVLGASAPLPFSYRASAEAVCAKTRWRRAGCLCTGTCQRGRCTPSCSASAWLGSASELPRTLRPSQSPPVGGSRYGLSGPRWICSLQWALSTCLHERYFFQLGACHLLLVIQPSRPVSRRWE